MAVLGFHEMEDNSCQISEKKCIPAVKEGLNFEEKRLKKHLSD
jgi:hypothetical protein